MRIRARFVAARLPATVDPPAGIWRDGYWIPADGAELDVPAEFVARWRDLPEIALEPAIQAKRARDKHGRGEDSQ